MGGTTPQAPAPSGNYSTYCTGRVFLLICKFLWEFDTSLPVFAVATPPFFPHLINLTRSILRRAYENITYSLNRGRQRIDSNAGSSLGIVTLPSVGFILTYGMMAVLRFNLDYFSAV